VAASVSNAIDQLLRRIAENDSKTGELRTQEQELKKVAPQGLDPLQRKVFELGTKVKYVSDTDSEDPDARHEL
jgi:hypothetical protein